MIREYLNGQRVKHFRPVPLVLVLSAAYVVISHGFNNTLFDTSPGAANHLSQWLEAHYSHVELLMLPIFAISSYLLFRQRGENFAEWFTFHAFLTGQRIAVSLITLPLVVLMAPDPSDRTFKNIIVSIELLMMMWAFIEFYKGHSVIRTIFLGIASIVISIALAMFALFIAQSLS
jgi:hypothetical protein